LRKQRAGSIPAPGTNKIKGISTVRGLHSTVDFDFGLTLG
jgi:hypothetical protein